MLRSLIHAAAMAALLLPAAALGQTPLYGSHGGPGGPAAPTATPATPPGGTYSDAELVAAGHAFFGQTSNGLAQIVQQLTAELGTPNGYVLGEEASGALFGGVRYGEGVLTTRAFGNRPVFWQGPSIGWDFGGSGSRVMMLVYHLNHPDQLLQRFGGVEGSAYVVGGLAMNVLVGDEVVLVPVRTGVGARLGVNVGYLKFTARPTWNPF